MTRFKTFKNGLQIIHKRERGINGVACKVLFGAGYCQEPIENKKLTTVAHLVEHLLVREGSSKKHTPHDKVEAKKSYSESNAFTSVNYVGYTALFHKKFLKQYLSNLTEYISNPLFTEEEVEMSKKVITEEFYRKLKIPEFDSNIFMESNVFDVKTFQRLSSRVESDLPNRIKNITLEDCLKHINDLYTLDNMIIVVHGNVSFGHVKKLVEKCVVPFIRGKRAYKLDYFMQDGEFSKPVLKTQFKEIYKNKNYINFRFEEYGAGAYYKYKLFTNIIQNQFMKFVRDNLSLSYAPRAILDFSNAYKYLNLSIPCSDENFLKSLNAMIDFIKQERYKITQNEFAEIVDNFVTNHNLQRRPLEYSISNLISRFVEHKDFRCDRKFNRSFKEIKNLKVEDYHNEVKNLMKNTPFVFLSCPEKFNNKIKPKDIEKALNGKIDRLEI